MGCVNDLYTKFKKTYFYLFVKHFIGIGNSAGSLIVQCITLFRTFQRLTAPKEFKTKIPQECQDLFMWAKNLFDVITKSVRTNPLKNFELFNLYALVFPLTILTFISTAYLNYNFFFFIFLLAAFFGLGSGVSYVKVDISIAQILMSVCGGFAFLFILIYIGCFSPFSCKKRKQAVNNEGDEQKDDDADSVMLNSTKMSHSIIITALIFYILIMPIMLQRWKLTKIITIIMGVIPIPVILIEFSFGVTIHEKFNIQEKLSILLINTLTLLIIPATEIFSTIVQEDTKNKSFVIASYFGVPFLIPFVLIITMIIINHPNINEKYRESKFNIFYYFELIDIAKQVGYAFAAAYDILWLCLTLEIAWVVAIIVFRPYDEISEHCLSIGNSLILIVSNGIYLHSSKKHEQRYLSFGISVFCFVLVCLPALLSLYLFFIFDFLKDGLIEEDENEILKNENEMTKCTAIVSIAACILSPIGWFCYGLLIKTVY